MKIRKKSMSVTKAILILKEAGAIDAEVAEGYRLTREILRNLDPEQKRSLIELKKRLGEDEFKEVILRALSGEERQIREPGQPKIYVVDEEGEQQEVKPKNPSQVAREKGEMPVAKPVPEFMDMPYNLSKRKNRQVPPVARPTSPFDEDTKTVRMSPKDQKNFTLNRDDQRRMSWIDKFIKEKGE